MSYGLGAYKKTSIHTASKEQILLMLYQAAIKNCKKAIEAVEQNQIAKKGEYIGKLQDIVIELNNSLDFEVGGKVAQELSSLYDYVLFASTQANIKIDAELLKSCLQVLITLYDGWNEAIKSLKTTKSPTNNQQEE
ncbi:MAG: flagellar export chaperone FliS [Bdellovibrionales bacterium RIFOXYD12_FULL_39_22]|nr:MAG: flagellar export chaperone FliS [Bdellovibrionales bacterium RIFOXYB1_FULL_39_21]OFZ45127.1 MAG: flagellar export chaperone FliS [Bdellovibrionales bacterium RIFOXYC12_FULL_39_17]OFZ45681.1 MAG: flagellar export chaperone FliS [Bdellovibrionales bacterium RIFOXYC1_FULL_39_130]OFZ72652.1 MAG: flagellar export chaperone FliS [Bdellovibrionales bacterium RIFOXYC2_FULL_39_8]OFZ77543.1 MAG: flagellar export chaperone FliS [Bdellovibrionales bacterium RIFOXYD1_FULL_39_84]OFZ91672.1 MAG: flag